MSGAELANLVNEAALVAVRRHGDHITAADLDDARDRVLLGLRRSSLALSADERRTVAYHEAGHALLASVLPYADPVHKVTILPTGAALGATQQLPVAEHEIYRRAELDDALAVRLGGRAAEELVFGEASTGGHDDLVVATDLARHMVREWGMSEHLGHIAWGTSGPVFLGEDLIHTRDYSDQTAHVIDEEITRILDHQADRAAAELARHRDQLDALAAALLEHETLDTADIDAILDIRRPPAPSGDGHAQERRTRSGDEMGAWRRSARSSRLVDEPFCPIGGRGSEVQWGCGRSASPSWCQLTSSRHVGCCAASSTAPNAPQLRPTSPGASPAPPAP
jgi:cell division protease FtsH